jgi:DNA repair exonuclease SbcCD ATPase subunit
MKTIRIKELRINNFKGIKALKLDFGTQGNSTIFGANSTGKTTIFDAFIWLLFNKDSQGRSDFEVKQLDQDNNIIHNLEVEVFAELLIDNEVIEIRKVLSEKWVKKRGSETPDFTGNETTYFYNSVPLTQKEFQFKINNLVDENIFKIITNPNAFVSLKWQDQRKTLVEIAQIPDDREIALGDTDLENLLNEVGTQKTIEEFTAQTKHSIKKAKEELDNIPARIEELSRSLPVPIIEKNVLANIENLKSEIVKIDDEISNKMTQYDNVIDKRNENQLAIQELQSKINDIEFSVKEEAKTKANQKNPLQEELNTLSTEFNNRKEEIKTLEVKTKNLESEINQLEGFKSQLRTQWEEINARKFSLNPNDTNCGTCGQKLPNSDALHSELEYKFNTQKQSDLKANQEKGLGYKNEQELKKEILEKAKTTLAELVKTNKELEKKCDDLFDKIKASSNTVFNADNFITESLLNNPEYNKLKIDIVALQDIKFKTPTEDITSDLKLKKQEIQAEIEKLQGYLIENKRIGETNLRIDELKEQEGSQNQVIAQFERKLFLIEKFNKKKIDLLDESVNKMFSLVKFKLFDIQINGGIKDTCEAMVNGVPFSNVNTAAKINAGIDIINTLCNFYSVTAPIFIDNRKSVVDLIDSKSQIVNLIVWPKSILNLGNPIVDGVPVDVK